MESAGRRHSILLDVTEPAAIQDAAARVATEIEGLSVLRGIVNNAGYPLEAPLEFVDREESLKDL